MKGWRLWPAVIAVALLLPAAPAARADPVIPPTWDIVADGFEGGTLEEWHLDPPERLSLVPGAGYHGSTALGVSVGQEASLLYRTGVAHAAEGYMTFRFHPNGVSIPDTGSPWVPGDSICLAAIVNSEDWWPPLVALYLRRPAGQGYKAYLAWPIDDQDGRFFDYESGQFDVAEGWQEITVGYRLNEWVAVWQNGVLRRHATNAVHTDPYGDVIQLGKTNPSETIPSGTLLFDDYRFQVPRLDELWVDAEQGDDADDGTTPATALRTISRAAELAGPGTTVHVQPGVYRETVWPLLDGSAAEAALYVAEGGPGTAVIRGSEPSAALAWTQLTGNTIGLPPGVDPAGVWYADLSAWGLARAPRFVAELDGGGAVAARLPLAREPDWQVTTAWKHAELWWAADGGHGAAGCDPATDPDPNCDYDSRSMWQLTDRTNDADPPGIEPGNLTTVGNLTGGTLVAIDTVQGHYVYRRTITAHDVAAGRVTVDEACEHDSGSGDPGLGWGSKYYVEGRPYLLDTPGEWWYDAATGRLYLWPPSPGSPATRSVEISKRDDGLVLTGRSYITVDGLAVELVNESAIVLHNWIDDRSYHDTVRNAALRYANNGVSVVQSVRASSPPGNIVDGFTLQDSDVGHIDSLAIHLIDWWESAPSPAQWTRSGVVNTVIRGNELHHLGFRTDGDNAIGSSFTFANKLRFEGNHVHDVAHNGVQFSESVIVSPRTYDFEPDEIKTGEILVKDNLIERACQLTTDCGAIKFWGSPPDNHVFRDVLITGNVLRDTFGWSWVSDRRGRWRGGESSDVHGLGGFGLYVDHASGFHAYRNVAYNTAYTGYMLYGVWRDGEIVYVNNIAANSLYGMSLGGSQYDTHGFVDARFLDNVIVNNEGYGIVQSDADGLFANLELDHNLYSGNGWRPYDEGGLWNAGDMVVYLDGAGDWYMPTLADVQAQTAWEDHGVAGDPAFWTYDDGDHEMHDGSWPDFHPTTSSAALIDRGVTALPASLAALLAAFQVDDAHWGTALDVGRYEAGFKLRVEPPSRGIDPGGTAHYNLRLFPPDLPFSVALIAASPSPSLSVGLDVALLRGDDVATLAVTDTHPGPGLLPGLWLAVPISSTGGGFEDAAVAGVLVGGAREWLPLIVKGY